MTDSNPVKGFHHVAMKVANFDGVTKFYKEVFGCTEKVSWGEGDKRAVMLDVGDGCCIEIFAGGDGNTEGKIAITHFCLAVTDVDAVAEKARAAGATITVEPKDVNIPSEPATPVRLAFMKGLAGEIIELMHNK